MLDEASLRKELEKTARDIVSRKFWRILDVALFLGFSRNHTDMIVDKKGCHISRIAGKRHVYAIDVLELFEKQAGMSFPKLSAKWYKDFEIAPPKNTTGQRQLGGNESGSR